MWDASVTLRYLGIFSIPRVASADAGGSAVAVRTTPSAYRNTRVSGTVVGVSGVAAVTGTDIGSGAFPVEAPVFADRNTCRIIAASRRHAVSHAACASVGRRTVGVGARCLASW